MFALFEIDNTFILQQKQLQNIYEVNEFKSILGMKVFLKSEMEINFNDFWYRIKYKLKTNTVETLCEDLTCFPNFNSGFDIDRR